MQQVVVRPAVNQHTVSDGHQLAGRRHQRRLPAPPLSNPMVEPGHRSIVPEMHHGRLNHRPPEPPAPLTCDPAVPLHAAAAPGAGNQPSVARQVVAAAKPGDIAYLRLHQQSDVVSDAGGGHQKPDVGVVPGHASQLLRQQQYLAAQRRHKP